MLELAVLVTWLTGSLLVAQVSRDMGHSATNWFFASLICSPLLALIALAARGHAEGRSNQ